MPAKPDFIKSNSDVIVKVNSSQVDLIPNA
jgi:hypothetical protein